MQTSGPLFHASPSSLVLCPQILQPQPSSTLISVYSTQRYYQVLIFITSLFCSLQSASRWIAEAIIGTTLIVSLFSGTTVLHRLLYNFQKQLFHSLYLVFQLFMGVE